jgi:hypothetical protein
VVQRNTGPAVATEPAQSAARADAHGTPASPTPVRSPGEAALLRHTALRIFCRAEASNTPQGIKFGRRLGLAAWRQWSFVQAPISDGEIATPPVAKTSC